MKILKILVVLIGLMLSIGNLLQAQQIEIELQPQIDNSCFTMKVDDKTYFRESKIYYDFTVTNKQKYDLRVRDHMDIYSEICPGNETCSYRWWYDRPQCGSIEMEIQCIPTFSPVSGDNCLAEGCVVIVDARNPECD